MASIPDRTGRDLRGWIDGREYFRVALFRRFLARPAMAGLRVCARIETGPAHGVGEGRTGFDGSEDLRGLCGIGYVVRHSKIKSAKKLEIYTRVLADRAKYEREAPYFAYTCGDLDGVEK